MRNGMRFTLDRESEELLQSPGIFIRPSHVTSSSRSIHNASRVYHGNYSHGCRNMKRLCPWYRRRVLLSNFDFVDNEAAWAWGREFKNAASWNMASSSFVAKSSPQYAQTAHACHHQAWYHLLLFKKYLLRFGYYATLLHWVRWWECARHVGAYFIDEAPLPAFLKLMKCSLLLCIVYNGAFATSVRH